MKVFKPGKLGVLSRCFEHERKFLFGVSALAFIPLELAGEIMLSEIEMWKFTAKRLGTEGALDSAVPKVRAEFLLNGTAYVPGGQPQPAFAVRAQVGQLTKDLRVSGDRYWLGSRVSEAIPISQMPLRWTQAYGGPQFARNPLGKGEVEVEIGNAKARPLPNLEAPRALMTSPRDRPEPAGMGAVDISWPQRAAMAGTHDQHWLQNLFPGFAKDIDWGIHNAAPRDQQQEDVWAGGDPYQFLNLHPTKPTLEGTLPQLRARAFITRSHRRGEPRPSFAEQKAIARRAPPQLEEVPLELRTLWFFPDAERAVMIWSGLTQIAEEDGADISQLVLAAEHSERAKPVSHYVRVVAQRLDEKSGAIAAMREHELLPDGLGQLPDQPPDEDKELSALEGLGRQNLHRRFEAETQKARDIVAGHGLDPDEHGPRMPEPLQPDPTLDELPDLIAKVNRDAQEQQAALQAQVDAEIAETMAEVDAAGIENFTRETLQEELNDKPTGPPTWTAAAQMAVLDGLAMDARSKGSIIDEIEDMVRDKAMIAQWQEAERNMVAAYRKAAHFQAPAPRMPEELCEATRARVREAVDADEDFGTLNFTGADLRGMDLRGANLARAFFESADLSGADLRGSNLDQAVLAHATLHNTRFEGASMREANLGKADLNGTKLDEADLHQAEFTEAVLKGASLQRANLTGATLRKIELHKVNARGMIGEQLAWMDAVIDTVDFSEAQLPTNAFLKVDLRGSVFDGASLVSSTFLSCDARSVHFLGANLRNARFVEECQLDGAQLSEAQLQGANLRGTSLVGASFRKANLDDADLCECNMVDAQLYQVVARRTRFEVSDLSNAELMSANLMNASLARARIYGADLRGANLFGADMARVRSDPAVKLDEAILVKVRIYPRHEEPKPEVAS